MLTKFIKLPDVREKVKHFRPKPPRKLGVPLKVEPRSNRHPLIGTAFDYLLRFELQRRAPHAIAKRWVADNAASWIALTKNDPHRFPEQAAQRARLLTDNAHAAIGAYLKMGMPTADVQRDLAAHAIRLAKLDSVHRASKLEPTFEEASRDDIQELVDLLAVVPYDELLHSEVMLLNPRFGEASRLVCGADTDLISGDLLVDFKTTKNDTMNVRDLDQILGYLLLARKQREIDPGCPSINRLGLYFSRHGFLWSRDASFWTSAPGFTDLEQWFFGRADEVFQAEKAFREQFKEELTEKLSARVRENVPKR